MGVRDKGRQLLVSLAFAVLLVGCAAGTGQTQTLATPTPTSLLSVAVTAPASTAAPLVSPELTPPASSASPTPKVAKTPSPAASRAPAGTPKPATGVVRLPGEPDPALTPGAFNPTVTQATISSTICVSGWTATVRPPTSYTTPLKIEQISQYGYSNTSTSAYEEDHLIPLELGGAPSDPRNLWPEPYVATLANGRSVGARVKDTFENSLKKAVCTGSMTLAAARTKIGISWVHYFYGIAFAAGSTTAPATPRPTVAPSTKPTVGPPSASLSVTFVSLPAPAVPGSTATMTATTSSGAVCSAKVTWPSGTVSAAAGLKTTPTAGSDGLVSWTWNVGSTTKPGTAKAAVTCTLGGSVTATATFPVQ